MPAPPPPPEAPLLAFHDEGTRISTRGLRAMEHPELSVAITAPTEAPAARALLTALAVEIIRRGRPLEPGERLEWRSALLELRTALLELYELEPETGSWRRGAPRLLATIEGEATGP